MRDETAFSSAAAGGGIDAARRLRVAGEARLVVAHRRGQSRLIDARHLDPLRLLFPTTHGEPAFEAVLSNSGGGVVGGDRHAVYVEARPDARLRVTGQAAEKIYRSAGPDAHIDNRLTIEKDAFVEWLPQETILFEGGRFRRRLRIDLAGGGQVLTGEILVLGRKAHGERLTRGLVHDAIELRRDGRLVFADALHMEGDLAAIIADPAGFAGAQAYATIMLAGPDCGRHRDVVRGLIGEMPGAAASSLGNLLLIRLLMRDPVALRALYGRIWCRLRADAAGLPPCLPRLWHV